MADGRHEAGEDRMLEFLTIMSDDDKDYPLIRNEDTLHRRAWIDRALAGVRSRLTPDELGEFPAAALAPGPEPAPGDAPRRSLYLVRNSGSR
ncbi:MAG: hypothetical protein ABI567_10110 [Gammaproteobacteria bacterium]